MFNDFDEFFLCVELLSTEFLYVDGIEFYNYIFPNNETLGCFNEDYSQPNAIYLYKDISELQINRRVRRRIMLSDVWQNDFNIYVKDNSLALCSGLSYRGRKNRLENAQKMNAMIFDLDGVGINELKNLLHRIGKEKSYRTLPQPTFIVLSGTGVHLYYVFNEPIDLFPNIKLQLKKLKYDLTFRIWEYKGTSKEEQVQYQSINQSFRMVGSMNDKYDNVLVAFQTGKKIDLEYLNVYVNDEKNKVDLSKPFAPTKYTLNEAKERFPDWYERVIIQKNKCKPKWHIKRDLYDWWLRQIDKVKGGHRYFFLMCMSIYGVKCDIPKKEVEKDMKNIFEEIAKIEHSNALSEDDILSALETYDRGYYNFTIDDIVSITGIPIQKNKRNYRTQQKHLERARAVQEIDYPNGEWRGNPSKQIVVENYIRNHPQATPTEIARELNISRTTVYKYLSEKDRKES